MQTENVDAQVMLKEASLEKQIINSSLIVEGKVISKKSFWGANHGLIYTSHTVEVYKMFKGESINKTIEIISEGGVVGLTALNVSTSLKLNVGDTGLFMLNSANKSIQSKDSDVQYIAYGSVQGFYEYDLTRDIAVNPFNKKQGISSSFYNEIMRYTKTKFKEVSSFNIDSKISKSNQAKSALVLGISDFSPTTATAGTKTVLTINGTDFGTTQGKVGFSDADLGGNDNYVDALNTQVTEWTNTQIKVEIPSGAGTGKIRVTHDDTNTIESATEITITYAETNVVYDDDDSGPNEPKAYPVQHIGANGSGGYTWEMETNFFNDTEFAGAKAAFERAFDNWVCDSGVNWTISGSATTTDVVGNAGDGVNVIRFDIGNELAVDVLGTCYSWYSGCGSGASINWFVAELDIVFDDGANWNFGPGDTSNFGDYDFESVALHELGHGHQLGHVIDTDDVMNYALSFNEDQRVIGATNSTAANDIQTRSTGSIVCAEPLMTNASCPLSVEEEELRATIKVYPNPAKHQFFIKNESFLNLEKVVIYDVSGRLISEHNISNTSRIKTINIEGASKGVYFVNIHSDNASITRKLIIN